MKCFKTTLSVIVRFYGKTKAAVQKDADADDARIPAAELAAWRAKRDKLMTKKEVVFGRSAPEFAYLPK